MTNDDLIYKRTARRIIDSPRSREQMLAVLEGTPPIVKIIRCRDCRKYRKFDCPMGITVFDAPDPDGYCYKAERRTDGTEQP